MIKRMVAGTAVCVSLVVGGAGAAAAHLHGVRTPGGNVATLPCEPFHGTTPGESQHSSNWDSTRGLHPIHWGLHKSPSEAQRSIEVVVVGDCP